MNSLSKPHSPKFNILSLGHRGVGKTVFLAGSYAELHINHQQDNPGLLWFECQVSQVQEKLEGILNYVAEHNQYPPPTLKITNFDFSLKYRGQWGTKTLCYFRWWDVPGENCRVERPEFRQLVTSSHSCCIFINADAVSEPTYRQELEDLASQVAAITALVNPELNYPFALVFTQCDRLTAESLEQLQDEAHLQPLIGAVQAAKAPYQKFYSSIPIVVDNGTAKLKAIDAAEALLWLLGELRKQPRALPEPQLEPTPSPQTPPRRGLLPKALFALAGFCFLGIIALLILLHNQAMFNPQPVESEQSSESP